MDESDNQDGRQSGAGSSTSEAIQANLRNYLKQGEPDPITRERKAPIAPLVRGGTAPLAIAGKQAGEGGSSGKS